MREQINQLKYYYAVDRLRQELHVSVLETYLK